MFLVFCWWTHLLAQQNWPIIVIFLQEFTGKVSVRTPFYRNFLMMALGILMHLFLFIEIISLFLNGQHYILLSLYSKGPRTPNMY